MEDAGIKKLAFKKSHFKPENRNDGLIVQSILMHWCMRQRRLPVDLRQDQDKASETKVTLRTRHFNWLSIANLLSNSNSTNVI